MLELLRRNNNQLVGEIPAGLAELRNLERVHLAGNDLEGCVPAGLADVPENDLGELGLPGC